MTTRERSIRSIRWWTKWQWAMVLWCAVTGSPALLWVLASIAPGTWDSYRKGYLR